MTAMPTKIRTAPNLGSLCAALNALTPEEREGWDRWLSDLPTFGGEEPRSTEWVWSWDETDLLCSDGNGGFNIVSRQPQD